MPYLEIAYADFHEILVTDKSRKIIGLLLARLRYAAKEHQSGIFSMTGTGCPGDSYSKSVICVLTQYRVECALSNNNSVIRIV